MKVQVLYKSKTGNTEKLAKAIYTAIPVSNKDIQRLEGQTDYDMGDIYFIGYWTDKGSASFEILDYLGELHNKKIALFGTCGFGGNEKYFQRIEENVKAFIGEDNEFLGAFMCQGKMPIQVRERYEAMKNKENGEQIDAMLRNFDEAMLHPDSEDMRKAASFVRSIFERLSEEGVNC
jgi:flavodoxin I